MIVLQKMSFLFSYEKIETLLSNFSFVFLFFSMVAYWIQISGQLQTKATKQSKDFPLLQTTNDSSFASFSETMSPSNGLKPMNLQNSDVFPDLQKTGVSKKMNFGYLTTFASNLALLFLLLLRWLESGHFPLSNLYESLMFLCWALTLFHLILETNIKKTVRWLGAITSPTALFTNAFANFSLPIEMQRSSALVPALQSNWLMMHVTVMILSYGALIFGSLLSIGFLILTANSPNFQPTEFSGSDKVSTLNKPSIKEEWAKNLDNLSYRMLGIGFPLLTIGILSGAVWANEAWGSYWSWDPKETWALLTWLVFAIYLHTRITKNWQGRKPAMIAAFGFIIVWICYLGVNLLGEGLHSYGWLQF